MTDHPGVSPSSCLDSRWINSPAWTLLEQAHDGRLLLVLSGGADETYIVDEAANDACTHRVYEAWQQDRLSSLFNDPECGAAVRQIQRVGALVPSRALDRIKRFSAVWLGDARPALITAMTAMMAEHRDALASEGDLDRPDGVMAPVQYCDDINDAEVLLVIRTNAGWQSALNEYAAWRLQHPHFFIDVAYHHTVGLGPYVVPGDTACVACMGHRVAHRWGDLPGPVQPAVSGRPRSIAALVAPLLSAPGGLLPFIEYGLSLNLQTLSSTRDRVFQLPWCPACGAGHPSISGALPLPWQPGSTSEDLPGPAGH